MPLHGSGGPLPLYATVFEAWSGQGRAYHDLEHLGEMVERCAEVAETGPGWQAPREVFLAILFHDAVYVPLAKDNEARSAELARREIAREPRLSTVQADLVAHWIERTAVHGTIPPGATDDDESLFLDSDMAILGADLERYRRYVLGVRREYSEVPDGLFVAGRTAFVKTVLASEAVFLSPWFRARLEATARENLERELGWLRAGDLKI